MKKITKKLKQIFNKKIVMIILVILAIVAVLMAIYFMTIKTTTNEIIYKDYTVATGHYGVVEKYDQSYTVEGYKGGNKAYYIKGNITAGENKKFTLITFNLYDNQNKLLGTAVGGLNEVKKGKTYEFKALSLIEEKDIDKIDHYEIKSIKQG